MACFVILATEFQITQGLDQSLKISMTLVVASFEDTYVQEDIFNETQTHCFTISYSDIHAGNGITKLL